MRIAAGCSPGEIMYSEESDYPYIAPFFRYPSAGTGEAILERINATHKTYQIGRINEIWRLAERYMTY